MRRLCKDQELVECVYTEPSDEFQAHCKTNAAQVIHCFIDVGCARIATCVRPPQLVLDIYPASRQDTTASFTFDHMSTTARAILQLLLGPAQRVGWTADEISQLLLRRQAAGVTPSAAAGRTCDPFVSTSPAVKALSSQALPVCGNAVETNPYSTAPRTKLRSSCPPPRMLRTANRTEGCTQVTSSGPNPTTSQKHGRRLERMLLVESSKFLAQGAVVRQLRFPA